MDNQIGHRRRTSTVTSITHERSHPEPEPEPTKPDPLSSIISQTLTLTEPFLRRLALGVIAAVHTVAILISALAFSVFVGVWLVRTWVEEPVLVKRELHFDYTEYEPTAVVEFEGKGRLVPAGHVSRVCLELVMPESDYNRYIGMFQVTAEVITSNGMRISTSSQPCMLHFRSLPIRLMRTFIMGIPLLLGTTSETQKIKLEILRYKEISLKPTKTIGVKLKPRSGTSNLPQIYEAGIVITSQLPRRKEIVYNWKWTFYVWVSLYLYITLLIVMMCCFKPFSFMRRNGNSKKRVEESGRIRRDDEVMDVVKRWRERSRSKRKVEVELEMPELVEGSASSVAGEVIEDSGEFAPSESSECIGG